MTVSVRPNGDLKRRGSASDGLETWEATAVDPAFKVSYSFIRKRCIVIGIFSSSGLIDPKLYINRGRGLIEEDSIAFVGVRGIVVVLDVGRFGPPAGFRVDPASFPVEFDLEVTSFDTCAAGECHAKKLIEARPEIREISTFKLPKYTWPTFFLPRLRRRVDNSAEYISAHYAIAAKVEAPDVYPPDYCWMSIVVPVYNTPARYLNQLLGSFTSQEIMGVELILSDDGSTSEETLGWLEKHRTVNGVQVVFNAQNAGIAAATNAALRLSSGEWVTFLDHDDLIAPYAIKMIERAIRDNPGAIFLFTDEVIVDDGLRPRGLMLKPAFDPVLLSGVNYINHFSVYRRDRLAEIGWLRLGYDGSQDYDLLLRYLEGVSEENIHHIPYPAYWWRQTGRSYSAKYAERAARNARRAISDGYQRLGRRVRVEAAVESLHRVNFVELDKAWPAVTIIIPSKNSFELISRVLTGVFERTAYQNYEVIVVDNGSDDMRVLALYDQFAHKFANFSYDILHEDFNFSHSVNRGIKLTSKKNHVLLLNNDIEIIDPDWLNEMVQCLQFDHTGIVGAKLLYPNNTIQHAGVIVGFGKLAGHWYSQKPRNFGGPMNRLHVRNSLSCVTGAAMLISAECLAALGPWDEVNFAIAYNDVDYCLRARGAGFRVVWTPFSCLYHHESLSRGPDTEGPRRERFEKEKERLQYIHGTESYRDPAIHRAYSTDRSEPIVLVPDGFKVKL